MKATRTIFMLLAGLSSAVACRAAGQSVEYCAFEVLVRSSAGQPVAGASVVEEVEGKAFARAVTNDKGIARICDAPARLIDIVVGGKLCGAASVRYLQAFWLETRRVSLIYDNCSGEEWLLATGCRMTIRTRDATDASPLAGVRLFVAPGEPKSAAAKQVSDQFGRLFWMMPYGATLKATLRRDGYSPMDVTERCNPGEGPVHEESVALHKVVAADK